MMVLKSFLMTGFGLKNTNTGRNGKFEGIPLLWFICKEGTHLSSKLITEVFPQPISY